MNEIPSLQEFVELFSARLPSTRDLATTVFRDARLTMDAVEYLSGIWLCCEIHPGFTMPLSASDVDEFSVAELHHLLCSQMERAMALAIDSTDAQLRDLSSRSRQKRHRGR
jgi:hypothetical protein